MHKHFLKALLALTVTATIVSCGTTASEQKPDWIDSSETSYAQHMYLTAVGQASKRDRAANRALANLANIFTVTITDKSQFNSEVNSLTTAGGKQEHLKEELIRNISTFTHHKLEGAEVKETWQSPSGEYYALAVLDKQATARRLINIINDADKATMELLEYSKSAPNFVISFHALIKAKNEQLSRESANKQLSVVANAMPAKISSKDIEQLSFDALSNLNVASAAESENSSKALQAALNQVGINFDATSNTSLKAKLDLTEPSFREGWYWLRGSYELDFIQDGNVISRKRWPVKISAKDKAQLDTRLRDKLNKKLPSYIIELLASQPSI